ncbi:hypothetical protein JCM33374_g5448 [Metschnikowia sp. JCM 33374]|nr:hypothetical protein JCM33374_g5448 [Metschnikowia sp. JCM 33374]
MFGAASNSTSSPFSFGGNSATTNPGAPAPSGFGAPAASGGIFGQKPASTSNLSSSTGAGGLFGNNAPKPATSGGLFGSGNAGTQNNTSSGLFGSNTGGQNTSTSGGLFGTNNTSTMNKTSGGGLFGGATSSTTNTNNSTSGGGLFSGNNAAAPSTGGLFGSSNTATNNSVQNGGLFGSSNNITNNTNTGGLFGSKPAAPAASGTGGVFGSSSNSGTGGGLFGGNTNNTNASAGLFGGGQKSMQNNTGLFGASNTNSGGLFGGQQQQPPPPQQQQPQLTSMTRFSDLPPELKNELQQLDTYIEQQQLIATTLDDDLNKHDELVKSIPFDVEYLHTKISSIKQALRYDSDQLQSLKSVNDELTEDISNIMHLIVQLATPGTKLSSSFHLNEFFVKKIKKYRELLSTYESVINESIHVTSGLERTCNESNASIYNVVEVVKNQYGVFMELCEVVAQLHGEVDRL